MDELLEDYLKKHGVRYNLHKHKAVFTVDESSKEENIKNIPGLHCKTLFLKDEDDKYYLIGMPAHKRLDFKKLEKHLGVKKLRFGSEEELRRINLIPGSVSIFGAIYSESVILIIEREVWESEGVGFHPNINTETLEMRHEDLERYYESLKNRKEIVEL